MSEIKHTAVALKMVTEGPGWHGPSVQQILKDVSPDEARARPATGGASIWQIALHMLVWEREAINGLDGGHVRMELTPEEDWPPIEDTGDAAWDRLRDDLAQTHLDLRERIKVMQPNHFDRTVSERDYPLYALIHGIIAHEAYHGGQMSLIRSSLRRTK
jgi:uncharacterized damage-inducible protein DinB